MIDNNLIRKVANHSAARYFLIGLSAFSLDYLTLVITYYVLNFPLFVATSAGFLVGFLTSFIANRYWVFGYNQKQKPILRQTIEYSLLVVANYFFTVFGVSFLNSRGVSPYIGKIVIMAMIMCWNYAIFRWVIFADKEEIN